MRRDRRSNSGLKKLTFAGSGNMLVTNNPIANGVGTLAVNVTGGILVLNTANTYTGATTVTNGLLQANGSLAAGSTVTVGAGGNFNCTHPLSPDWPQGFNLLQAP